LKRRRKKEKLCRWATLKMDISAKGLLVINQKAKPPGTSRVRRVEKDKTRRKRKAWAIAQRFETEKKQEEGKKTKMGIWSTREGHPLDLLKWS